jgi:hypothetical protein
MSSSWAAGSAAPLACGNFGRQGDTEASGIVFVMQMIGLLSAPAWPAWQLFNTSIAENSAPYR